MFEHFVEHAQYVDGRIGDGESELKYGDPGEHDHDLCGLQSECDDYGRVRWINGRSRPV